MASLRRTDEEIRERIKDLEQAVVDEGLNEPPEYTLICMLKSSIDELYWVLGEVG